LKSGVTAKNLCANNDMNICQAAESSSLIAVGKKYNQAADFAPASY
jgi:hypothetical protein